MPIVGKICKDCKKYVRFEDGIPACGHTDIGASSGYAFIQFGSRGSYHKPIYNEGLGVMTYSERDRIEKAAKMGYEPKK